MGFIKRCNKIIKHNLIMQYLIACMLGYSLHGLATCVIVIVMELTEAAGSGSDRPVIPVEK